MQEDKLSVCMKHTGMAPAKAIDYIVNGHPVSFRHFYARDDSRQELFTQLIEVILHAPCLFGGHDNIKLNMLKFISTEGSRKDS